MSHETSTQDQKALAIWAAECAEHVLPCFEERYPEDNRHRKAIEACRTWARTGIFKMADVRRDSLAAHAAARAAEEDSAAQFAARAAGHAVAIAHVPSHAVGAAWYGVRAAEAAGMPGDVSGNIGVFQNIWSFMSCNFQENGQLLRGYCDSRPSRGHDQATDPMIR